MSERSYTESEYEEAVEYIRKRLENETSAKNDVITLLLAYAEALLLLFYRESPSEDINALVEELADQLIDDTYILGVDEHDDKRTEIMLWMNSERGGDTMEGRIRSRVGTFLTELGALYYAANLLGLSMNVVIDSIGDNLKNPWDNPIIKEAKEKIDSGELVGDKEQLEEPHFGKGVEISSMGALQKIMSYHVADAFMWYGYQEAVENGAIGYFVIRGSSYPCDTCQSEADVGFHPIDDNHHIAPLHMNCVCSIVYVYENR